MDSRKQDWLKIKRAWDKLDAKSRTKLLHAYMKKHMTTDSKRETVKTDADVLDWSTYDFDKVRGGERSGKN